MSDGTSSTATVQAEVRQWLADNWDQALPRKEWLGRVADSGWAAPSWPAQWHGKGLDPTLTNMVKAEFRQVGADGTGQDRTNLWASTVLAVGSDELKGQFLRRLVMGEVSMCLR